MYVTRVPLLGFALLVALLVGFYLLDDSSIENPESTVVDKPSPTSNSSIFINNTEPVISSMPNPESTIADKPSPTTNSSMPTNNPTEPVISSVPSRSPTEPVISSMPSSSPSRPAPSPSQPAISSVPSRSPTEPALPSSVPSSSPSRPAPSSVPSNTPTTKPTTPPPLSLWDSRVDTEACHSGKRQGSFPFVSGDGFRCLADFICDETTRAWKTELEQWNDTRPPVIFVKTDKAGSCLQDWHPKIPKPYVLITHNSDKGLPGRGHQALLDDPKLLHWFVQNNNVPLQDDDNTTKNKLTAIPIGMGNRRWGNNPDMYLQARAAGRNNTNPPKLMLMNFSPRNKERQGILQRFQNDTWATTMPFTKTQEEFLSKVLEYKFAISPRGNGLDCHRTWELLTLGIVPIVRSSTLDSLYKLSPAILVVKNWQDITPELLQDHWKQHGPSIRGTEQQLDPVVTMRYWMERIWQVRSER